jgi:hypothetical protein
MGFFGRAVGKYLYRTMANRFHRIEFLMELEPPGNWFQSGEPRQAAVCSTFFRPLPFEGADDLLGQLCTSLLAYGRMVIIQSRTRTELTSLVRLAAAAALQENTKVILPPWTVNTETTWYRLWPRPIVRAETLTNPVSYVADVHGQTVPHLWLEKGGRLRDTWVLDSFCALLAVQTAVDALDAHGLRPRVLPSLILGMDYYFLKEGYSAGGETQALLHGFDALRNT